MDFQLLQRGKSGAVRRLAMTGSVAALLALGGLTSPASASTHDYESILGGHLSSAGAAKRIARAAERDGFRTHVQRISTGNYEAEIFNGGTRSQAAAVCAKAKRAGDLPHCSVEREFHGDGWN
jgi:hypothetical protein